MPDHSPFDVLAATYDETFTSSAIGGMQRERVWQYLLPLVKGTERLSILEINCGTGEDALKLAAMGHSVLATDASEKMIGIARTKALNDDVHFESCSFDELHAKFAGRKFDLVLSNFGGLNCIDQVQLEKLSDDLSALVKDKGKLVLVLMGRCCLWEIMHYGCRGKLKTAFRRFRGSVDFNIDGHFMSVYYYSPKTLRRIFHSNFDPVAQYPVGLFIPPSYMEKKYEQHPDKLQQLYRKELKYSSGTWANYADHYCMIFQKNNQSS